MWQSLNPRPQQDVDVGGIDEIPQINNQGLVCGEHRGVPRDVLLHRPDNAGGGWLDGAVAEAFGAADPDAEDAVELPALARRRPLEDDFGGAWGGAVRRRCVGGEDRRLAVGEGEIVLEKEVGAWCGGRALDWFGEGGGGGGPKVMVAPMENFPYAFFKVSRWDGDKVPFLGSMIQVNIPNQVIDSSLLKF
ncbi:hypothetical protein SASPL_130187 [Salvia splendens]|uniref:Uncharacterized protein n=1 Tax=Salvia splendens TaxID=180675 RepID=A0A8X8ZJS7_SALSN|nr:hypothetical protein SASPL_130187 [Salvia splendens]